MHETKKKKKKIAINVLINSTLIWPLVSVNLDTNLNDGLNIVMKL